MTSGHELHVPPRLRKTASASEQESIESAKWLIEHMCEHLGIDDLGDSEVLDFGCGVKFTQALINHSLPIKSYVGIDVDREMVDFLQEHVDDPRFEYFHIDVRNEMYNPDGDALSGDVALPIEGRSFDVICLFSVFTHLAPDDARRLLVLLRRYVKPEGRLFFTLYVDELTEAGHGLMDRWAKVLAEVPPEQLKEHMKKNSGQAGVGTIETFMDLNPKRPLEWAVYSERYMRQLIDEAGWEALTLSPPDIRVQHHFVCAPRVARG
jgi:SAM-dependent methyltransferase